MTITIIQAIKWGLQRIQPVGYLIDAYKNQPYTSIGNQIYRLDNGISFLI